MGVSAVKVGFDAQVARFEELVFGAISSHRMDDISSVIIGVQDKCRKSNVAKKKKKRRPLRTRGAWDAREPDAGAHVTRSTSRPSSRHGRHIHACESAQGKKNNNNNNAVTTFKEI